MSPQKSKKYRREITPAVAAAVTTGSTQTLPAAKPAPKNIANIVPLPTVQSFTKDLGWIGFTTLIVVILMVVAYYVVPR